MGVTGPGCLEGDGDGGIDEALKIDPAGKIDAEEFVVACKLGDGWWLYFFVFSFAQVFIHVSLALLLIIITSRASFILDLKFLLSRRSLTNQISDLK